MAMSGGKAVCVKTAAPDGYSTSTFPIKLYVYYKTSQSIANNSSTITCGMYVTTPSGWDIGPWDDYNGSYVGTKSLTFNGDISNFSGKKWIEEDRKFTVKHNSDGTGKATIYWKWGVNSPWGNYVNPSGSFTITLPTIDRESSLSLSSTSVNVGSSITANISRKNSSFTHTVEFYLKGYSSSSDYYKKYTGVGTSKSFTIPTSWYSAMPSSESHTAYCRITTYNGSTKVGDSVSKSFTVKVPSSVKPTVGTITLDPVNITINGTSYNYLVKGKKNIKVSVADCSAGTGSSIDSYAFSGSGVSSGYIDDPYYTGGPATSYGTLSYKVTVKDKRGRTASKTKTITCYNYYAPSFKTFSVSRSGAKLTCKYEVSYAAVNNKNGISVNIYVDGTKKKTLTTDSGTTTITLSDADSTCKVYATVTDYLGGSDTSSTKTLLGETKIFNVKSDGKGFAIGKKSEQSGFECAWASQFYNTINTNSNIRINSANSNYFEVLRTGVTDDIDQNGKTETVDVKGQIYVNDEGDITFRRRYFKTGNEDYTTQSYWQLRDSDMYVSTTLNALRGRFRSTTDATGDSQNNVALRVGNADGEHLDIDGNEIIAKDGPKTTGKLNFVGSSYTFTQGASGDYSTVFSIEEDSTSKYLQSLPTYKRTYEKSPNMYITSAGTFGRGTSSSERYKREIRDVVDEGLNPYKILNIPVRQYQYKEEDAPVDRNPEDIYIGFIAEEVEKEYPAAAEYNEDGEVEMWNIKILFPALFKIVQDQQKEIEELKSTVQTLTAQN